MNPAGPGRRRLRASLVAGAVYDLGLGAFIMTAGPRAIRAAAGLPPADLFTFRLAALPLFLLPALYLAAARARAVDPFRAPVLWARGAGGAIVIALAVLHHPPGAAVYAAVGIADLAWAAVHAALWGRPAG